MKESNSKSSKHIFKKNYVLYSKLRPYLNKVVIAPKDGFCTSEILPLDFGDFVIPKYAQIYLMSPFFVDYTTSLSFGVKMPRLGTEDGKKALFPLPPLSEQKQIVAAIEKVLPLIELYGQKEQELTFINSKIASLTKKAILQEAVQGKLCHSDDANRHSRPDKESTKEDANCHPELDSRSHLLKQIKTEMLKRVQHDGSGKGKLKKEKPLPPVTDEEKPFEIPDNWCWCRLGEVCERIHYGYTASANEKGNARLLRITDIQDNKVDWQTVPFCTVSDNDLVSYGLKNRDIVIARTGGTIGKNYIIKNLNQNAVFASYLIRCIPFELMNEEYLKIFLESPFYWEQLKKASMGTGQPNVNGQALSYLVLPLPPLSEQKQIVLAVEKLLALADKLIIKNE